MRRLRLSLPASEALVAHGWPGNVRELEQVIERAVAFAECDELRLGDLPASIVRYGKNLMLRTGNAAARRCVFCSPPSRISSERSTP